jgi:hypothetical protein
VDQSRPAELQHPCPADPSRETTSPTLDRTLLESRRPVPPQGSGA